MSGTARVGCSGWSYLGWKGPVYPPNLSPQAWFDHYATLFDTVELNTTFYRLPQPSTVDGWRVRAPEDFCYSVKVGRFGTHRLRLRSPSSWLSRHVERMRRLGPHLGPQLLQLPPRWRRNPERLAETLAEVPADLKIAVEIRDPSWLHDDVFEVLAKHDAALCVHDMLPEHPWVRTASWSYVRFHGPNAVDTPYRGSYGREGLKRPVEHLSRWLDYGDVFAYFNNDVGGSAVSDAILLRSALARAR